MARDTTGEFAWTAGATAWVVATLVARPLVGSDPLLVAAQAIIETAPGWLATWAIETFGVAARTVLVAGVATGLVITAGTLGAIGDRVTLRRARRSQVLWLTTTGVVIGTAVGFYLAAGGVSFRWLLATVIALTGPGIVWWIYAGVHEPIGRRQALGRIGGGVGALVAGGAIARILGQPPAADGPQPGEPFDAAEKTEVGTTTPTPRQATGEETIERQRSTDGVVVSVANDERDFTFDFEGMPPRRHTAEEHFVVDKNITAPNVAAEGWSLSIRGAVDSEKDIAYETLLDHPDRREMTVTTLCISNTVGGDLIGTTDWIGIPVRMLLADAGITDDAVDVVTHARDGYSEAIPWSVVRDRDDIILAIGMDGKTLPAEHGFPARLLVPGRYGMKSTKWITEIELADSDHTAYWDQRGWDEEAVVNTLSYVRAIQRRNERIAVGGIAYAGTRGVERVEVSLDGGQTWNEAALEDPISPHARRRWQLVVERPDTGPLDVIVRATDGAGNRQTSKRAPPHPSGSAGWHSITVSL
ncbi:molybdopterin-dependent oxidoreductase [Halorhabdus sp. BNX81]|uniref:molybdopterin-dependent oxidoreductase n=1 Tax=Halorhabdus sp. BNX81 TaxID=2980181 RepID=UPI0023DCFD49|nr:molybdopterin-dependent oxidoreductase [Halorhabdus sp. BNX81]